MREMNGMVAKGQAPRNPGDATAAAKGATAGMTGDARQASEYAGDLGPTEAWEMLARERDAVLIDVRSRPEWSFVGVCDLSAIGKRPLLVAWQHWSVGPQGAAMAANAAFAEELAAAGVRPDAPAIFICRSGARSRSAAIAMTRQGYARAYNLTGGFEGQHDSTRHRSRVDGWKAAGLPWIQD